MSLLEETLNRIRPLERGTVERQVQTRWDSLTKPRGSLGRLEECVIRLACIRNEVFPAVDRQGIYIFCGDHGVTVEGVSPYPSAVTREMVKNFVAGGAAINVLCRAANIATQVVDAGVMGGVVAGALDRRVAGGTKNFAQSAAMSKLEAELAIEHGIRLAADASKLYDLVGVGEMGIGNSSSASALLCAFTGASVEEAVGRGAGLDDAGLPHKREVIRGALLRHGANLNDPISIVAAFGGFEIAMMAGFLLGAAANGLPVVLDGFISCAGFLIARALFPLAAEYVFFAHESAEPGHRWMLRELGAAPLLQLGMRLGEGTGAVLAMGLITSAVRLYREMATFSEAGVSDQTVASMDHLDHGTL